MRAGSKVPSLELTPIIEWRAQRIQDPVERLRYLRLAMEAPEPRVHSPHSARVKTAFTWKRISLLAPVPLLALLFIPSPTISKAKAKTPTPIPVSGSLSAPQKTVPNVWLVDRQNDFEVYSNGLRVENAFAVANQRRTFYAVLDRNSKDTHKSEWRSAPAGIVFHTTESHLAPFEAKQNKVLQRIGKALLGWIQRNRSYHYVIDRFGRVFRVVEESDTANHAGISIWADDKFTYLNLNSSFLGIAFEAQTEPGEPLARMNSAQIYAGRVLTEMVRSKYRIPTTNCVTHAQVSVNPSNMQIGYHTDWAGNFPFVELGLKNNYELPVPSLQEFGFGYNSSFVESMGARMWKGLLASDERVRQEAATRGVSLSQYRALLHQRYREIVTAQKSRGASEEKRNETE